MVYENVRIEHVDIGRGRFRNFSGIRSEFNKLGNHEFSVFLPPAAADELQQLGWYVKRRPPYREGEDEQCQMDITVSYDTKDGKFPKPLVKLVSWDGVEQLLNEETIGILDSTDIDDAEMEIRPYNWEVNGKSGCKAYLQELTVRAKPPRRALDGRRHVADEEDF